MGLRLEKSLKLTRSRHANIPFFQLLQFLVLLRGEPIGLSVGGVAVISKSFVLSVSHVRDDVLNSNIHHLITVRKG